MRGYNLTLVRIKERHFAFEQVVPRELLRGSLVGLSLAVPQAQLELAPKDGRREVALIVAGKRQIINIDDVTSIWKVSAELRRVLLFLDGELPDLDLEKAMHAATNSMLATFDPSSTLLTAQELMRIVDAPDRNARTPVASQLLPGNVGLLQVTVMNTKTTEQVVAAMKELTGQGARAWILDLRGNQGGLLNVAIDVADLFLDSGTLATLVQRTGREARHASRGTNGDATAPLVVLVDRETASGAELVALALLELGRAVLIGERTHGSSVIHELYKNNDGSMFKLAVAEWLPHSGRSIQGVGIVPDIELRRTGDPPIARATGNGGLPSSSPSSASIVVTLAAGSSRDTELRLANELLRTTRSAERRALLVQAQPLAAKLEATDGKQR